MAQTRPFTAPRPTEYAAIPEAVRVDSAPSALPPGPRPRIPGRMLWSFQRDTPKFLLDLRDRYGDAASFYLNGQLFIGMFAPAMVHQVTVAQQSSFIKGVGFERMRKVLGEGLLTNEEPIHLRHRRMMQPPFHKSRLDGYAQQMSDLTRGTIGAWLPGSTIYIGPQMMRLTLLIVARTLFGTDADRYTDRMMQPPFHKSRLDGYAQQMSDLTRGTIDAWLPGSTIYMGPQMMRLTLLIVARTLFGTDADRYTDRIAESMDIAIDRIERTMLPGLDRFDSLPLPYWQAFHRAADDLAEIAEELIRERRARGVDGDDLLGLLLALRDEDGSAFTDAEIRDEALTLILSGHETTANALTWAFSWLGTRPDVHEMLRHEALQQEWVTGSAPATVADVMSCEVAGQVVAESLRMAPPVWVAPRRALADLDIEGVKVPRGAHVLISQYVTQRDPKYFPNPHTWEPSRWTAQLHASLPRGAYFPFGAGTRKCLGDQFALLESRIILLHAAARTRLVAADPRRPIPVAEPRATYRARGTVPMVVT